MQSPPQHHNGSLIGEDDEKHPPMANDDDNNNEEEEALAPNDADADDDDADDTFQAGIEQDRVTGSPRPSRTDGFGTEEDAAALRFVPERTRNTVSRLNDETDEWAEREEMLAQTEQMLVLKDPKHKDSLLSRLNTFRRNRAFCDVVLFIDGRELLAHKAVLAAISPPLFDMFLGNSGTDEDDHTLLPAQALALAKAAVQVTSGHPHSVPNQNGTSSGPNPSSGSSDGGPAQMAYFEFAQADFDSMEALVEFAYTARLRIGSRRMIELYRTAFALQVFPVAQACAAWLAEHLTINNCIGIRRQANVNEDNFLLGRVDAFIRANFEAVINESVEFSQLPCIRCRVIVPTMPGGLTSKSNNGSGDSIPESGPHNQPMMPGEDELAQCCLRYFQHGAHRAAGERIDAHIAALAERTHLLVASEMATATEGNESGGTTTMNGGGNSTSSTIGPLQDANELDAKTSLGSCDIVRDYKRSKHTKGNGKKKPMKPEQLTHHVTGATPVKLVNTGTGRLLTAQRDSNKFTSHESLCSLSSCSVGSAPTEGASAEDACATGDGNHIVCVAPTATGFWVCLALLFHRLVRISIHLSDDEELIRSSRTSSVASSTDAEAETSVMNGGNGSVAEPHTPTNADAGSSTSASLNGIVNGITAGQQSRNPLPTIGEARCAIGAAYLDGKILISGGYDRNICLKSAEELNIEADDDASGGGDEESGGGWRPLAPMCRERARFDASVVDGKVYAVAGSNGTNDLCSCECFDPSTGRWTEVRPLERARSHNGCASLNGQLYCIGGSSDQSVLADCARYDPKRDEWTGIAPLNTQRSQAGCTAWRGLVVSAGGCDRWNCLDSVEAYDPNTNQWHHLARLRTPRRGCAVAVLGNSLYVIGGHDGQSALSSVEVLDATHGHWRPGPSMQSARVHHHAVSAGDGSAIFVIGGFNGTQFLSSMEVLESEETGWRGWREKRKGGITKSKDTVQQQEDEPGTASTTPTPRA